MSSEKSSVELEFKIGEDEELPLNDSFDSDNEKENEKVSEKEIKKETAYNLIIKDKRRGTEKNIRNWYYSDLNINDNKIPQYVHDPRFFSKSAPISIAVASEDALAAYNKGKEKPVKELMLGDAKSFYTAKNNELAARARKYG